MRVLLAVVFALVCLHCLSACMRACIYVYDRLHTCLYEEACMSVYSCV